LLGHLGTASTSKVIKRQLFEDDFDRVASTVVEKYYTHDLHQRTLELIGEATKPYRFLQLTASAEVPPAVEVRRRFRHRQLTRFITLLALRDQVDYLVLHEPHEG